MALLRLFRRWPRVATGYVLALLGAYIWWILQSPPARLAELAASRTDTAPPQPAPWVGLPASSIWSGNMFGYWAVAILLCLGALERIRGALTTAVLGTVAHVVGTVVSEGVTAARIAAGDLSSSARHLLDVGPSYVVAACATAVIFSPGANRWLRLTCAVTLVPLLVAAFNFSDEAQVAAIGHATAMLVGVVAVRLTPVRRWRSVETCPTTVA